MNKSKESHRFFRIANKMMCGISKRRPTEEQKNKFAENQKEIISWINDNFPRELSGRDISVGVLGAIGKGMVYYGMEKIIPFCRAIIESNFTGIGDPAQILSSWLNSRSKYDCDLAYKKTVAAIRMFVAGKQRVRVKNGIEMGDLGPALSDLFDWDSDYSNILKPKRKPPAKKRPVPQKTIN